MSSPRSTITMRQQRTTMPESAEYDGHEPPRNPWFHDVDAEEFEEYYDRKQDALEQDCDRKGCEKTVEWPREYCSSECEHYAFRKAAAAVFGGREPIPPDEVPERTPTEMQTRIDELREAFTDECP